ncbi:MAG: hypothetical protein K9J37_12410 [Saprospiraceae bacterium]|nr:hypothetical protein [Saprospiraceae bacterium]MCF8250713.1 hypothetical protein [Saprospiraceae bacterium]MCF8279769.1 hypothetical protein [Bacteroidales bacterium]MCF8310525.1 hypothetical protein [Saprospiraceae bacterium]MCF8440843.1 hypothetical protein [Saprospiraceae bacterium]
MQPAEKILELPSAEKTEAPFFLAQIKHSRTWVTLTNWEYWPIWAANLPLFFIILFFALRARRLLFFSAVNPVIETGGMWGESKFNILRRIQESHVPATIFVKKGTDFQAVIEKMRKVGLHEWPVIAKPDVGERGLLVKKIRDEAALQDYLLKNDIDFLVQKFIPEPLELAVMCHRMPGSSSVKVTSVCIKETLKVTGDGSSTVRALMLRSDRARLQLSRFEVEKPEILCKIPKLGETLELEPIGNHCKGTMFLNGNDEIDEQLTSAFQTVFSKMDHVFYGRFDIKCQSFEHLRSTGEFKTMEFNGIGAEAGHIYDPTYPVWKKYRDIYQHWNVIFKIYKIQVANGVAAMTVKEGIERLRIYFSYQKSFSKP